MTIEKGHLLQWRAVNTGLYDPHHTDLDKRRRYEEHQRMLNALFPTRWAKPVADCGSEAPAALRDATEADQ